MFIYTFGGLFICFGLLILALPLMLIELSRPRDWLMGGLFLFLGLFLLEENYVLEGSINLFVISVAILLGKMILEISRTRWYQLSIEEKKRIGSFERWIESLQQVGQMTSLLGKGFFNFFKSFGNQSKKSLKEKKWVHPELKEEIMKQKLDKPQKTYANKISNEKPIKNDESS